MPTLDGKQFPLLGWPCHFFRILGTLKKPVSDLPRDHAKTKELAIQYAPCESMGQNAILADCMLRMAIGECVLMVRMVRKSPQGHSSKLAPMAVSWPPWSVPKICRTKLYHNCKTGESRATEKAESTYWSGPELVVVRKLTDFPIMDSLASDRRFQITDSSSGRMFIKFIDVYLHEAM